MNEDVIQHIENKDETLIISYSNLEMYCVYHKNYYIREDNYYFTFFGVNEVYPKKDKNKHNILEYELKIYNPFLQKRGYMETSAYLHVYWNNLYKNKDMIGFSQYDMKHNTVYAPFFKFKSTRVALTVAKLAKPRNLSHSCFLYGGIHDRQVVEIYINIQFSCVFFTSKYRVS